MHTYIQRKTHAINTCVHQNGAENTHQTSSTQTTHRATRRFNQKHT